MLTATNPHPTQGYRRLQWRATTGSVSGLEERHIGTERTYSLNDRFSLSIVSSTLNLTKALLFVALTSTEPSYQGQVCETQKIQLYKQGDLSTRRRDTRTQVSPTLSETISMGGEFVTPQTASIAPEEFYRLVVRAHMRLSRKWEMVLDWGARACLQDSQQLHKSTHVGQFRTEK